jgi:hypothetical protein
LNCLSTGAVGITIYNDIRTHRIAVRIEHLARNGGLGRQFEDQAFDFLACVRA